MLHKKTRCFEVHKTLPKFLRLILREKFVLRNAVILEDDIAVDLVNVPEDAWHVAP
jgi:hypothetical protein